MLVENWWSHNKACPLVNSIHCIYVDLLLLIEVWLLYKINIRESQVKGYENAQFYLCTIFAILKLF